MRLKETPHETIGIIELRLIPNEKAGDRGFWIGIPFHGKGLMSEAVFAVNDYAFDVCGIKKLQFKNAKTNMGSRRVKEKTGAVHLRDEPDDNYLGNFSVSEVWELTAERWRAFKKR